jgi:predicted transposase YbfD/YdcC
VCSPSTPNTPKKTFERVIASRNHLLTQVKDNQPSLRRKLELGTAGRKSIGSDTIKTKGRNRWETRELTAFPAKAWFRDTPWEKLIKTVLRLERTVCKRDPKTGLCKQTIEVVFWISSASNQTPKRWNEWIRAHWRIENGSHYVRDTAFAEDASRIRKNPDIVARLRSFAYNMIRASGCNNIKNARWRAALDINMVLEMPGLMQN